MLTPAEQDAVDRARTLLERTHYDETGAAPERVTDARVVARGAIELADALQAARSAQQALKQRCEQQQAILGKAIYAAIAGTDREP